MCTVHTYIHGGFIHGAKLLLEWYITFASPAQILSYLPNSAAICCSYLVHCNDPGSCGGHK